MTDLTEEQARRMDAGLELDLLVATRFLKWEHKTEKSIYSGRKVESLIPPKSDISTFGATRYSAQPPPEFSRDWMYAGPLLEAMNARVSPCKEGRSCTVGGLYQPRVVYVVAPTPQLAIARACAVLVARDISRDELEN